MEIVHFIVNPIAGRGAPSFDEEYLSKFFSPDEYSVKVKISQYHGHASILTGESVEDGANIIVACGGDGTINEVASCLVHTDVLLGIIPMGSGNGLAYSLNIPKRIQKALCVIKNHSIKHIDVATVNGKTFLSNMGIGFDAKVISNFNQSNQRRFMAYLKAVIKSIKDYKNTDRIKVEMNGATIKTRPFMFFVSNSKVMGYDLSLTRTASLQDGLLDVVIIDNMNKGELVLLGLLLLIKTTHFIGKVKYYRAKEVKIAFEDEQAGHYLQADGELHKINQSEVHVGVEQRVLHVLAP